MEISIYNGLAQLPALNPDVDTAGAPPSGAGIKDAVGFG